jgi:hypothetical protein
VIDDSDDPSRAATPMPSQAENDGATADAAVTNSESAEGPGGSTSAGDGKDGNDEAAASVGQSEKPEAKIPATVDLPPEIKQKLRKLEKLESTYPGAQRLITRPVSRHFSNCLRI